MQSLGGIAVAQVTATFLDGRVRMWEHVEWLWDGQGVTLVDGPALVYLPLHALRMIEWIPRHETPSVHKAAQEGGT